MSSELPRSVWSGTFTVLGIEMRCHVLDTGERVIEKESMEAFIQALEDGHPIADDGGLAEFVRWQNGR